MLLELHEPIQRGTLLKENIEQSAKENSQAKCIGGPIGRGRLDSIVHFAWEADEYNDYSR
jgi:hypothetical protein